MSHDKIQRLLTNWSTSPENQVIMDEINQMQINQVMPAIQRQKATFMAQYDYLFHVIFVLKLAICQAFV